MKNPKEPKVVEKPHPPPSLGSTTFFRNDPHLTNKLESFGNLIESQIAKYQVEHYVVARKEEDEKLYINIIPCAIENEIRVDPKRKERKEETKKRDHKNTATGIVDAIVKSAPTLAPLIKDSRSAVDSLRPKNTGIGLRIVKKNR